MIKIISKVKEKIALEFKCIKADYEWYLLYGQSSFCGKKPSFYMKHTKEEAERILKQESAELRKLIEDPKTDKIILKSNK